jgi:hypothetical protein
MAAAGHEHHHDMIADRQIVDPLPQFLDDARGLMPQRHRQRPGAVAVDDRQVGMAQPRRGDADQHLAAPRRCQLDRLDRQRPTVRIGTRRPQPAQYRSLDPHVHRPFSA